MFPQDVRCDVVVDGEPKGVHTMASMPAVGHLVRLKKPSLFVQVQNVCWNLEIGKVQLLCTEYDEPVRKRATEQHRKPAKPEEARKPIGVDAGKST